MFTNLEVYSSKFYNNKATKGTMGIQGGYTKTLIVDCLFGNEQQSKSKLQEELRRTEVTGGFLYFPISSEVTLERSQFRNGISQQGGAIYLLGGLLKATQCEFKENRSGSLGGAIYLTTY